ncbi:MAG: NRDE family protein [Sedimenticola sp.]|uniref:NRDE family protein n=1 Tax=Sedimenticola thiotaurini TaxID=1543721 RepID=A0A558D941_9GAMM|nr:NRDE family protein [Sedimenticola sp.]MCW9022819.1 NRDE family protein [Sedimenticola sp.]TVT57531.1 MAG: NRDE family protein [Sedimenticola thiotaurini]
MCTLVILYRPAHQWPLLLAGNRDEMRDRPTSPPAYHWPAQPEVIAGLDHLGGGTWLGMNHQGVVAVVMNREGTLGPAAGKQSRGDLVLQALQQESAEKAVSVLLSIKPESYRAFNLFIGDNQLCYWIRNRDDDQQNQLESFPIAPGLHMLASRELDDPSHPRIKHWLPHFQASELPVPEKQQWESWSLLLAAKAPANSPDGHDAMNMDLPIGFATVSSSLIALPAASTEREPIWLYADGAPDQATFNPIKFSPSET